MLFFRSEEAVHEWCSLRGHPLRPLVTIDQLWILATTWYSTRLREDSRRPQPQDMRTIFARVGLKGEFWDPQSDSCPFLVRRPFLVSVQKSCDLVWEQVTM